MIAPKDRALAEDQGANVAGAGGTASTTVISLFDDDPPDNAANLENIPRRMREQDCWVVYRREPKGNELTPFGQPKTKKIPYHPREPFHAFSTREDTPGSFEEALTALEAAKQSGRPFDGLGFVISCARNLVALDLDNVRDPGTGTLTETGQELWDDLVVPLGSYTEVSPSGEGFHVFVETDRPKAVRSSTGEHLEVYPAGGAPRFITVTGEVCAL
ncbi:putative DNA primase/helicase [Thioalkalivibrio sp. ALE21]|uniref:hypothetical protein n=1 Tax=Thioalkalivibrio sp. ALE21 TaxID=1158175 RepID=UPI000D983919|nr:hypothetical protein [Thioalkalivibrio sp. ALE21]PYG00747.1 putative DNA primase/helicase [Thioalkalivibrio sp. ALE21]